MVQKSDPQGKSKKAVKPNRLERSNTAKAAEILEVNKVGRSIQDLPVIDTTFGSRSRGVTKKIRKQDLPTIYATIHQDKRRDD